MTRAQQIEAATRERIGDGVTGYLRTIEGHKLITGTMEVVRGRGKMENITQSEGGAFIFDYGGETEFFWDEQKQCTRSADGIEDGTNDEAVYLDADGNEYLESELEFVPGWPGEDNRRTSEERRKAKGSCLDSLGRGDDGRTGKDRRKAAADPDSIINQPPAEPHRVGCDRAKG